MNGYQFHMRVIKSNLHGSSNLQFQLQLAVIYEPLSPCHAHLHMKVIIFNKAHKQEQNYAGFCL